jgi:hypothetical protein
MLLNASYPAYQNLYIIYLYFTVSHICNFTALLLISRVFEENSTPIVIL